MKHYQSSKRRNFRHSNHHWDIVLSEMIQSQSYCETPFLWRPRAARLTETRTAGQPSAGAGEVLGGHGQRRKRELEVGGAMQVPERHTPEGPHGAVYMYMLPQCFFKKMRRRRKKRLRRKIQDLGRKPENIFDWDDWRSFSFFPQQREILILQSGPPAQFSSQRTLVRWKSVAKWACGSVRWHGTSFFLLPSLIQGQALHQLLRQEGELPTLLFSLTTASDSS